jgi:F0F1-type ATP synthase membrane subunit b/b'
MRLMKWVEISLLTFSLAVFSGFAGADNDTVGEKVQEAGSDIKKNTKEAWRDAKDEACEWVNGKMECAGQKAGNAVRNAKDEVKDKVDAD